MRGTASLCQYRATQGEPKVRIGRDERKHKKKKSCEVVVLVFVWLISVFPSSAVLSYPLCYSYLTPAWNFRGPDTMH